MSDFALVPSDLGCSFCKWMADIGRTCECALKPCHQFVRILPARATVWVVDRRSTQKLLTRSQLEFPLLACKRKSEPVGVRSRSWQPWSWPNLRHLISYSCFKDPRKPLIWVMHCEPIQCAMTNVSTPCCTWSWASSTGLGSKVKRYGDSMRFWLFWLFRDGMARGKLVLIASTSCFARSVPSALQIHLCHTCF